MRNIRSVIGIGLVVGLILTALADGALSWFASLTVVGGLVLGGLMLGAARLGFRRASAHESDSMLPLGQATDIINVSRIRVAGIGGAGLVVMAWTLAATFPLIGWSVGLGLAAGVVMALSVIGYRHRHGPLPTGHGAPRGGGVLFGQENCR
ncbi:MAG: hypothetical protein HQ485_01185 [Acidobacteria bacterium]|nr:hypothetical protein [Acidobacteriota bacterium]